MFIHEVMFCFQRCDLNLRLSLMVVGQFCEFSMDIVFKICKILERTNLEKVIIFHVSVQLDLFALFFFLPGNSVRCSFFVDENLFSR